MPENNKITKPSRFATLSNTPKQRIRFSPLWIKITSDVEFCEICNSVLMYEKFTVAFEKLKIYKGIERLSEKEEIAMGKSLLKAILVHGNAQAPMSIGAKIYEIFFGVVISSLVGDFVPIAEPIEIYDELNEMQSMNWVVFWALGNYAKSIKKDGIIRIEKLALKKYFGGEIRLEKQETAESSIWWLSGAHDIFVSGEMTVKSSNDIYMVKSVDLHAIWYDRIDAKPSYKTDNAGKATAEYIWSIVEWVANTGFPVNIHWEIKK